MRQYLRAVAFFGLRVLIHGKLHSNMFRLLAGSLSTYRLCPLWKAITSAR